MQLDQKLIDRLVIGDMQDRYVAAASRVDEAGYRSLWAEDAVWEIMGNRIEGRDAIIDMWLKFQPMAPVVMMFITNGQVDLDHDAGIGTGEWHVLDVNRSDKATDMIVAGRYHDSYVRGADGAWRFASRRHECMLLHELVAAAQ